MSTCYERLIDGNKFAEFWKNDKGELHREDGPAITNFYENEVKRNEHWYLNDMLHRENGPAYVNFYYNDGSIEEEGWYRYGELHREDGPAIITCDIYKKTNEYWLIKGQNITDEVNEWIERNNIRYWSEWSKREKAFFKLKFMR